VAATAVVSLLASAAAEVSPRIVGGNTTTAGKYPWQAALVQDETYGGDDFDRMFCGGELIHPYIVMTAAHCVYDTDFDFPYQCPNVPPLGDPNGCRLDTDDVDVILGRTTLSGSGGSEHDAKAIYVNRDYDPDTQGHDTAFIVLSTKAPQMRILLAGPDERALWDVGRTQSVTGYGNTSDSFPLDSASDTLKAAMVPVIADSTCGAQDG
jgi:secreted trypsin-like serine protease